MNDEYSKRIEVQDLTETPPIEEPARQYFLWRKLANMCSRNKNVWGVP